MAAAGQVQFKVKVVDGSSVRLLVSMEGLQALLSGDLLLGRCMVSV